MKSGKCVIFGASPEYPERISLPEGELLIIAADGGIEHAERLGASPDLMIGDFDSTDSSPDNIPVTVLPHVKDTTDMNEAVRLGIERGCTEFHIYGGTGGRLDHTLANIQLAADISKQGLSIFFYGKGCTITAVTNGTIYLPSRESGYLSVFAHDNECYGVMIKGLMYETSDITLRNDFALGVSNEFIGKPAEISVKHGTLIVYYET